MENVQHDAAATTTTEAALLDDDSERKRAEQEEKEVQTSSPTEAAENKNQGSRIESSPERVENVQDRAHMQTPPPESQLSSVNMPRTQFPEIAGMKIRDLGLPVIFEVTVDHGEDVAKKLGEILKASNQAICVISASGLISEAEFRLPDSSDVHDIYKGTFSILSLSGNIVHQRNDTFWWLSVILAGLDRNAFGGLCISLIADGEVSLLMMNSVKEKEKSTENEEKCDEAGTSTAAEITAKASLEDSAEKKKKKKKKKKKNKKKSASTSGGADVPAPLPCVENLQIMD